MQTRQQLYVHTPYQDPDAVAVLRVSGADASRPSVNAVPKVCMHINRWCNLKRTPTRYVCISTE